MARHASSSSSARICADIGAIVSTVIVVQVADDAGAVDQHGRGQPIDRVGTADGLGLIEQQRKMRSGARARTAAARCGSSSTLTPSTISPDGAIGVVEAIEQRELRARRRRSCCSRTAASPAGRDTPTAARCRRRLPAAQNPARSWPIRHRRRPREPRRSAAARPSATTAASRAAAATPSTRQ